MANVLTKRSRVSLRSGFTLIEVLVVVAIIALLVAILIPSLAKARDQAKRAACASCLHQQTLGMAAYASDHKSVLPARGFKTYTVAEVYREIFGTGGAGPQLRELSNLGILRGGLVRGNLVGSFRSWVGKDWNVLYCPSTYVYRDMPSNGVGAGGVKTIAIPVLKGYWSFGGYNYSVPLNARFRRQLPEETHQQYLLANIANPGSYPNMGEKNVYPRDYIECGYYELLQEKQGLARDCMNGVAPRIPQGCQALVSDWSIGGPPLVHGNGVNVMYSDGHAKFLQYDKQRTSGSTENSMTWYIYNQRR